MLVLIQHPQPEPDLFGWLWAKPKSRGPTEETRGRLQQVRMEDKGSSQAGWPKDCLKWSLFFFGRFFTETAVSNHDGASTLYRNNDTSNLGRESSIVPWNDTVAKCQYSMLNTIFVL